MLRIIGTFKCSFTKTHAISDGILYKTNGTRFCAKELMDHICYQYQNKEKIVAEHFNLPEHSVIDPTETNITNEQMSTEFIYIKRF